MIFHVGTGAGLYSELGAMLECMCYCHINNIQFILYADDANFSDKNGWSELFDSLGCESHDPLNINLLIYYLEDLYFLLY